MVERIVLPKDWNRNPNSYQLTYIRNEERFVLFGTFHDNNGTMNLSLEVSINERERERDIDEKKLVSYPLFACFQNKKNLERTHTELDVKEMVKKKEGKLSEMIPGIKTVVSRLQRDFIDPLLIAQPSLLEQFCTSRLAWKNTRAFLYTVTPIVITAICFCVYMYHEK